MALVDNLRQDALIDILPVEAGCTGPHEILLVDIGLTFLAIIASRIDGLHFDGDKVDQLAGHTDAREYPVYKVPPASSAVREPQLLAPALAEDGNTLTGL